MKEKRKERDKPSQDLSEKIGGFNGILSAQEVSNLREPEGKLSEVKATIQALQRREGERKDLGENQ